MQSSSHDIDDLLERVAPILRNKRIHGWLLVIASLPLICWGAYAAFTSESEFLREISAVAPALCIAMIFGASGWVRSSAQRLIMPHLADTIGLDYQRDASSFLQTLPKRLLPKGTVRAAEDLIQGTVAERQLDMAEVDIRATRGKRHKVLFRGYVVRVENAVLLPAFFIAAKRTTTTWFNRIYVGDLVEVEDRIGTSGEVYGVWMSPKGVEKKHPALSRVLDILTNLETEIDGDATLYSATSTGEELHIALSHHKDLFGIGGLFAGQDKVRKGVENALNDLRIPLKIASTVLEAEQESELNQNLSSFSGG